MKLLLLTFLLTLTYTQQCYNANGVAVKWWAILKVPPKIGSYAYAYFDSNQQTNQFIIQDGPVDSGSTALTRTLEAINLRNLSRIAWNDQKPNGATSSSSAHSKGTIAFDIDTQRGFLLSHSIPRYPNVLNGTVFNEIASSQQVFGQHLSCFTLDLLQLQILALNLLIIRPFIYQTQVQNTTSTINLYRLASRNWTTTTSLFQNWDLKSVYGYSLNAIFKNARINGSIFEDGLISYLNTGQLIAQTWGRPIQPSYCVCSFKVKNVMNIKVGTLSWKQTDDHSKWAYTDEYACFGDMNRMKSQWMRGGAYYCLKNAGLVQALKEIVTLSEQCTTPESCP